MCFDVFLVLSLTLIRTCIQNFHFSHTQEFAVVMKWKIPLDMKNCLPLWNSFVQFSPPSETSQKAWSLFLHVTLSDFDFSTVYTIFFFDLLKFSSLIWGCKCCHSPRNLSSIISLIAPSFCLLVHLCPYLFNSNQPQISLESNSDKSAIGRETGYRMKCFSLF